MSLQFNQSNVTLFALDVPDANITGAFKLNVSNANIPGISIPVTTTALGNKGLGRANLPGSTFEFDPLSIRVLVDDNLQAWVDIYKWMLSINNYITHYNNGWEEGVLPGYITLHVLDNIKREPILSYNFYGAWPTAMDSLEFDYTEESDPAIFLNVTFNYRYFTVEKNGVIIETRESIKDQVTKNSGTKSSIAVHPKFR